MASTPSASLRFFCPIAIFLFSSAHTGQAGAGPWIETDRLFAARPESGDWFGYSVDLSGDTAAVGAWFDDGLAGIDQGAAYIFVRNGREWLLEAAITALDSHAEDWLGTGISIDGNTLLAGAPLHDGAAGINQGAAYIFVRSTGVWTRQASLVAGDATAYSFFGASVALSGDTAIIGAEGADIPAGVDHGAAYIFVRTGTTWTQQAQLTALDSGFGDYFGLNVAIQDDTAVVGALFDDGPAGVDQGSAYVFVRSGSAWTQQAKLTASDAAPGDIFGSYVAIDGDTIVVGASKSDGPAAIDQGAAYVFVRNGSAWTQQARLTASAGGFEAYFGSSVTIQGDAAIVGAYHTDGPQGKNQGAAYLFSPAVAVSGPR